MDELQYVGPAPRFSRLTWQLVRLAAHHGDWAVSEGSRTRIQMALQRAGQDYTLTPAQFFAGKLLAAATFSGGLAWTRSLLHQNVVGGALAGAVFRFFMPELWLSAITKVRNLNILTS